MDSKIRSTFSSSDTIIKGPRKSPNRIKPTAIRIKSIMLGLLNQEKIATGVMG